MFTQPCFLRKKTPELIDKLVAMGYNYPMKYHKIFPNLLTIPYKGHGWGSLICVSDKEIDLALKTKINENPTIDCGVNEELFFALAALRDDTDKHQWFIYNSMDCIVPELRDFYWFKCEEDKIEDMMYYDAMYLCCKKATVEEIIEHFKGDV